MLYPHYRLGWSLRVLARSWRGLSGDVESNAAAGGQQRDVLGARLAQRPAHFLDGQAHAFAGQRVFDVGQRLDGAGQVDLDGPHAVMRCGAPDCGQRGFEDGFHVFTRMRARPAESPTENPREKPTTAAAAMRLMRSKMSVFTRPPSAGSRFRA